MDDHPDFACSSHVSGGGWAPGSPSDASVPAAVSPSLARPSLRARQNPIERKVQLGFRKRPISLPGPLDGAVDHRNLRPRAWLRIIYPRRLNCGYPQAGAGIMIRKLRSGQYRLYSRKKQPGTGRRRNLGTFATRAAAEKHERAVQYFKRGRRGK